MGNKKLLDYLESTLKRDFNSSIDDLCTTSTIVQLYHGNVWTKEEKKVLDDRGQEHEQFNVISMFAHQLLGYWC